MKRYIDCIRTDGMCGSCSLVNKGLDCHNKKINGLLYQRNVTQMTQKTLADKSGVNIRQIQKYESAEIDCGNILPRTCRTCGCIFLGGPRAWYCPSCRADRIIDTQKRHKANKAAGKTIPLGSLIACEICGKETVKKSGMQKYCPSCAALHLKTVDNQQSLSWGKRHPEKTKMAKLEYGKHKRLVTETRHSGVKYIYWDREHSKWIVRPYVDGKQITVGRSNDLEEAKRILELFLQSE